MFYKGVTIPTHQWTLLASCQVQRVLWTLMRCLTSHPAVHSMEVKLQQLNMVDSGCSMTVIYNCHNWTKLKWNTWMQSVILSHVPLFVVHLVSRVWFAVGNCIVSSMNATFHVIRQIMPFITGSPSSRLEKARNLFLYGSRVETWPSRKTGIALLAALHNLRLCIGSKISSISNVK